MRICAALFLALLLAACAKPVPQGVTELTYATPYTPSHPFSRADQRWMDYVEQASGGSLKIKPVWSGALLSSDMSMEELRHGVADIGLITPIYVRGGTHLIRIQSGFYSGAETIPSQLQLYRCIEQASPEMADELTGLKVLAVQGGLLPGIITRDRPVRTLADLKGLRLRAPTELMAVLESLGADPVNMPMGEVYPALAKGVIDGVLAPVDTFRSLHFSEVAHYFNDIPIPRGAYPARAIGTQSWDRLSAQQQQILEKSIAVWEAALETEINLSAKAGLEQAAKDHVVISHMPEDQQARFQALYLQDAQRNARALDTFGIDGLRAFNAARKSVVGRDQIKCGDNV